MPCNGQAPTQAPTQVSVIIQVLSRSRQLGSTFLVGSQDGLQLFTPTIADQYNWSTSNTSELPLQSCLMPAGPYLYIGPTCLIPDSTYVLRLSVQTTGVGGLTQVSRNERGC